MAQLVENDEKENENYSIISLPLNHHAVNDDYLLTHGYAWINEGAFHRNRTLAQSSSATSADVVVWDQTLVEKYYILGSTYSVGNSLVVKDKQMEMVDDGASRTNHHKLNHTGK